MAIVGAEFHAVRRRLFTSLYESDEGRVKNSITTTEGLVCLWEIAPSSEWTASSELPLLYDTGCSTPIMELEAQGSIDLTILLWNEVSLYTTGMKWVYIPYNKREQRILIDCPTSPAINHWRRIDQTYWYFAFSFIWKCRQMLALPRCYEFPLSRGLAQLSLVLAIG